MVKQSPRLPASNVSANSASLWSSRLQEDAAWEDREKSKKKKKTINRQKTPNKPGGKNVAPEKSLDCVMASAAH